jgi:hypothetical protein
MKDFLATTRRDFMCLAGASGAAVTVSGMTRAAAGPMPDRRALVVYDPDFVVPEDFLVGLGGGARQAPRRVALDGDPVRLWRDGLRDEVSSGAVIYGLTLWPDLLIFRGLAAEVRRHVTAVRQDRQSGRFAWMIA